MLVIYMEFCFEFKCHGLNYAFLQLHRDGRNNVGHPSSLKITRSFVG